MSVVSAFIAASVNVNIVEHWWCRIKLYIFHVYIVALAQGTISIFTDYVGSNHFLYNRRLNNRRDGLISHDLDGIKVQVFAGEEVSPYVVKHISCTRYHLALGMF